MTSSELLRWLFGLDVIPEGAEGLQLAWQYPPAAWGWFFIFTSAILVVFWSYRRIAGATSTRVMLAIIRGTLNFDFQLSKINQIGSRFSWIEAEVCR